jgi:hypothetical protein
MSQKPKKYYGKGGLSGLGGIMNRAEELGQNVNRNLANQRHYAPQPRPQYQSRPQYQQRPQPQVRPQIHVPQYVIFNFAVEHML